MVLVKSSIQSANGPLLEVVSKLVNILNPSILTVPVSDCLYELVSQWPRTKDR
jgi:hypothetical protein